jgi:membrane protease subunit HflK
MRETNHFDEYTKSSLNKLIKTIVIAVIALTGLIAILSSVYTLNEDEDAVITTFGNPTIVEDSGLHFKVPFVQRKNIIDMSVRGIAIGYDSETGSSIENESLMITKDMNFVNVDFYVEWQVNDAVAYLYASENPQTVLKTLAMSYIRDTIGSYNIDQVLTTEKAQIQSEIKDKLIERLETEGIGVTVRSVAIQDAEPPTNNVANAFLAVENAKQKANETVNKANTYRNQQIPSAEAQAKSILEKAEATKQARISEANGQIARFNSMYAEYIKFPEITKSRMYYEAMEDLLPNLKVIIQGSDGEVINIINSTEKTEGGN